MFQPIPNFTDYEINEAGDIVCTADHHQYTGRRSVKAGLRHNMAYVQIVDDGGQRRAMAVRSLVLLTFRGEKPAGTRIIHKNGNTRNHRLSNLDYAPLKTHLPKVRKSYVKKLTAQDVSEIRRLLTTTIPQRRIAVQFGVHESMITMIRNGKRHAGVGIGGQG